MKKSAMISGMNFGSEFLTSLYKSVLKAGGTEEDIYNKCKTGSSLFEKWAKDIVENKKSYQHLTVIDQNIQIPKATFNKDEFFSQKFIWMSPSFQKDILPEIEQEITSADYTLTSLKLNHPLSNHEIRKDLGEDEVVSPHQWAQEQCALINTQSQGKPGSLLVNGYANIRYVQLSNGTTLAVFVLWDANARQWDCDTWELDDDGWDTEFRFLARS